MASQHKTLFSLFTNFYGEIKLHQISLNTQHKKKANHSMIYEEVLWIALGSCGHEKSL